MGRCVSMSNLGIAMLTLFWVGGAVAQTLIGEQKVGSFQRQNFFISPKAKKVFNVGI